MKLSIVTTLYQSVETLKEFYARIRPEAEKFTGDYEIILVNDGSPDDSLDVALALYRGDPHIRVIDLSRNFGHHKAMMTGLAHARGDLVFLIDCDLEEKPELLGEFHRKLRETGADVVYGIQEKRKGGWFERTSGRLFFWLFNSLSNVPLPSNVVTVRLMTRRYVESLISHRERETIIAGLWAMTGYRQLPIAIDKGSGGRSTYSLLGKVTTFINAVTSFSDRPLVFIFYLGSVIVFVATIAALRLIVRQIFYGINVVGWPSLIVSIWLLGGLTIFCLGLIAIYLSKVFIETKNRPYTIIRQLYEQTTGGGEDPEREGG